MLGHLGINVPDLTIAKAYYDALLPLLGYDVFFAADDQLAYLPAGGKRGTYLFLYPSQDAPAEPAFSRHRTGLQHLAFMVPTRADVHRVHAHVAALGAEVLHEPQDFPQYPPPYFATFWLDPFGIMLEAVCHHDRD